jgi:5-(carboxyamino)imidazole ribonucleotide synthase
VGVVGAGQLARMLAEAASALGIDTVVLSAEPGPGPVGAATEVLAGTPEDDAALKELAARSDVVTFDHELVDLDRLAALEQDGVAVRPGTGTLAVAVDKGTMRRRLSDAGLPVPAFVLLEGGREDRATQVDAFASDHGWPVVLKACRGGYDGRGVWPVTDRAGAGAVLAEAGDRPLLAEARVDFRTELAVLVARRPGGEAVWWPPVETAQLDGVCREVLVPGSLDPGVARAAGELAAAVAAEIGSVGVLAVELFWDGTGLLVNEVAARPHNSGHWSIEGAETSQFENHLRAVLDLPLGVTAPRAPAVASVNVFGGAAGADPRALLGPALALEGTHVHLYGKGPRPGRKLGHVTVLGDDPDEVRRRAWAAAVRLGTPTPAGPGPWDR